MGEEFNQAPGEVKTCLESVVGKDEFEKIKNGEPPKDPSTGDKIRACFENMKPGMMRNGGMSDYREMPDGIREGGTGIRDESAKCVTERKEEFRRTMEERGGNLGEEVRRKMDEAIKGCFKNEGRSSDGNIPRPRILPEGINQIKDAIPDGINIIPPKTEYEYQKPTYPQSEYPAYPGILETQIKFSFPPESIECVLGIYGKDAVDKITRGEIPPPPDVQDRINECMTKLKTSTYQ